MWPDGAARKSAKVLTTLQKGLVLALSASRRAPDLICGYPSQLKKLSSYQGVGNNQPMLLAYGKLRDELLNREILTTLEEAKVLIEQWRKEYK